MANLITAPASLALTLCEAKQHCIIDEHNEDALLTRYIKAATTAIERRTKRAFINQTWREYLPTFPTGSDTFIELLPAPLGSISSITYVDVNGDTQTLNSSLYTVEANRFIPRVQPAYGLSWPACREQPESVKITFVAGYGASSATVPEDMRQAIAFLTAHYLETRQPVATGSANPIPHTLDYLIEPLIIRKNLA